MTRSLAIPSLIAALALGGIFASERDALAGENAHSAEALAAQNNATKARRIVASTALGPDLSTGIESEISYRRGVLALLSKDTVGASEEFERSIAIRPDRTGAHVLLGVSLLLAGSTEAISQLPLALSAFLADFEAQSRTLFNATIAIFAGLALLLFGGLLVPIVRALPSVVHEISEALPAGLPHGIRRAYPIVLLMAPVYLLRPWAWLAGLGWLLALFLILVRRRLTRPEKWLVACALLVVMMLPAAGELLGTLAAPHSPRSTAFSLARSRDPFLRDYVGNALQTAYAVGDEDPAILFELALHKRREGRVQDAAVIYEKLLGERSRSAEAHVNLGNILYARGDVSAASDHYKQAIAIAPGSAAAHYNLGLALSDGFDFGSAKSHFRSASALNFDFVRSLSKASDEGKNVIVVDETKTAKERWRWLFANRESLRQTDASEVTRLLLATALPGSKIAYVVLALLFAAAFIGGRLDKRSEPCVACGTPLCRKCRVRFSKRSFCEACATIAKMSAPMDVIEDAKTKRFRKAHAGQRIVGLLLALLLPGAGHIYAGRRRLGRAILFCAGVAIFLLVTAGGPIKPLPTLDAEALTTLRPALVLVLVNLHIIGLIHFFALARRSYS
ncbi:MAG: tetratricopeptide repeat protein [bacterium]